LPAGAVDDAWNVFVPWPDYVSTVEKNEKVVGKDISK